MPQSRRDMIRDILKKSGTPIGTNAGLLMDRYLEFSVKDDEYVDARDRLHHAIGEAMVQSLETYRLAFAKNYAANSIPDPKLEGVFRTDGRMVIGLGRENVLETGLALQHTFGTPLIPGSALKGLSAHYCDQVWGASDSRFKLGEVYHKTIFGTTEDSGHISFHDAWIVPESLSDSLKPDVITPHHGDYYSKKGATAPTDYDDPNPIVFLTLSGRFHVAISCDVQSKDGEKWTALAFNLLSEALSKWGIGGKTNADYGRLVLENLDRAKDLSLDETNDSEIAASHSDVLKPLIYAEPAPLMPKYKKGEMVEVTRIPDPNTRRDAAYFKADDGICGLVIQGTTPSVEIGQKSRLEICGVMKKERLYNFAGIGRKRELGPHTRDKRG